MYEGINRKGKNGNESEMLTYLNDEYGREFTTVEYIPARRGFNDGMNENILIAETEDGIRVEVRERVGDPGYYSDNYLSAYGSKLLEDQMNYSSVPNLQYAKTYVSLRPNKVSVKDLQGDNFTLTNEMVIRISSIIAVSSVSNEEILKELYDVYNQMQSFGFGKNVLVVGFSGEVFKSEKYVNNFSVYGVQEWNEYDKSVKELMSITQSGLSFEQFKQQLSIVGD